MFCQHGFGRKSKAIAAEKRYKQFEILVIFIISVRALWGSKYNVL